MRQSQPIDMNNKKLLAKLGIKEETEEEKAAGQQVVKVETVDEMLEFEYKPTVADKILRPFRRLKIRFTDTRHGFKNYFIWRKLLEDYYSQNIYFFLPMFIKHLELYIDGEQKYGIAAPECKEYKISTIREAADIMRRLVKDDYISLYTDAIEEKWGKFPYEKTTYANGSIGFQHLTPDGYDEEMHEAYEKANADQEKDLKRLGELMTQNMQDWWD